MNSAPPLIAVVIPCYRVSKHVLDVVQRIGAEVGAIYVVDDKCPENTGRLVAEQCRDPRVKVIFHEVNQGVGGATISGYRQALADGASIVVKIDGDGQMDTRQIGRFVQPILDGNADYTKGNRFFDIEFLSAMPRLRLFGNSALSLISKVSSGYWDIMDPTNGFTAIHATALQHLPLDKIDRRYFFESDMLFRLNTLRAVVQDIPLEARYGDEQSSLNIARVVREFPPKYLNCFAKRVFYNYFLRDFNAGTIELLLGAFLLLGGTVFGTLQWGLSIETGIPATSGEVMLAALPILLGFQLLISATNFDIGNIPRIPLQKLYPSS